MINANSPAGDAARRRPALPRSLQAKMLYISLAGLLAALAVFFAARALGGVYIDKVYMASDAVSERRGEIYLSFCSYVTANSLSGTDYAKISEWSQDNPYAALLICGKGGGRRVRIAGGSIRAPENEGQFDAGFTDLADGSTLYPVRFSDGMYVVSINDTSELRAEQLVIVGSVALGVLCFIVLIMLYAHKLTSRIAALSREATEVARGDLERSIPVRGSDEIAILAASMEEMRLSVIRRMSDENRAWEANSGLITAISHDIRTPMTSVIGYLGLLSENGFEDAERSRQFVDAAYNKAIELKSLTDELFGYFLVFGRAKPELNLEELDGELLFEQLIAEAEFDLRDSGFNVRRIGSYPPCAVSADPLHLSRVMNNIVSNIKKYADPAKQVTFILELSGGSLSLCVSNYIRADSPRTESTKIGLMSCRKVMESMGGSFESLSDAEHFSAELRLPAEAK